jgi:hypothetical protein
MVRCSRRVASQALDNERRPSAPSRIDRESFGPFHTIPKNYTLRGGVLKFSVSAEAVEPVKKLRRSTANCRSLFAGRVCSCAQHQYC